MITWMFLLIGYLALLSPVLSSKNPTSTSRPSVQSTHRLMGRHVCVQNKVVTRPIKQVESYCKPVYKTYTYVCDKEKYRLCSSFRVVYEKALRTVHKIAAQTETLYVCCPGWTQVSQAKHDCTQAICTQECKNGGKCKKPDYCHCPLGWTGKCCDIDVNECVQDNGKCDHSCVNMPGSYRCKCHEGFVLQSDGRRCKINLGLFPEYQRLIQGYEDLSRRMARLEKLQEQNTTELSKKVDSLAKAVAILSKPPSPSHNSLGSMDSPFDRINSLSEQIAILEERLGSCSCNQQLETNYAPRG
ncbi:epidermal growth factor-like protein 7 [Centruroides vittatus]|uniref:epidermal growth factor-like protein 7 n=1 Tax=Centruroides vittatus TaxID=120091 RepID=UPI00350EB95A